MGFQEKMAWAMMLGMAFAGTRTAYVVVPAALCFLVLMTFNRRIILAGVMMTLLGIGYIAADPYSPIAQRITSAFFPSEDESYQVREENQMAVRCLFDSIRFAEYRSKLLVTSRYLFYAY